MEPRIVAALNIDRSADPVSPITHLLWFFDGVLLFFVISHFGTAVLPLDNDFFYAVFIWTALTFLFYYVRITNSDVIGWIARRWRASLLLGGLVSIYVVIYVWSANPTSRPSGLLLIFELFWRGLAYGVVTGLVLTGFPVAVVLGLFGNNVAGLARRCAFSLVTLVLVWVMSAAYHVGFAQYDGEVSEPQLATTAISAPALITVNPIGSIMAQTMLHLAATFRTFESDSLVPPAVEFIPDYSPPGVFGPR